MTFWNAISSLLVPAHFTDWYVSSAAQGTHFAFGVCAFILFSDLIPTITRRDMSAKNDMFAAMILVTAWEVASGLIYGGLLLDHLNNSLFMACGAATAYASWHRERRLLLWCGVAFMVALGVNAYVRL